MTVLFIDFGQRLEEYLEHRLGFLGQSISLLVPFIVDSLTAGMTHCRISIMYEWTIQSMNFAGVGRCASVSATGQHVEFTRQGHGKEQAIGNISGWDTSARWMVLSEFFEPSEYFDHPSWIGLPRHVVMSAQVVASTPWKDRIHELGRSGIAIAIKKVSSYGSYMYRPRICSTKRR